MQASISCRRVDAMPPVSRRCCIGLVAVGALLLLAGPASAMQMQAASTGTPVEKVVALLDSLAKQVSKEGSKEAKEYDKYACFCKEQADEKIYQIEKSEKKIEKLGAEITALETEITDLNADILTLGEDITKLETDITTNNDTRIAEHATYLQKDATVQAAIDAVEGATAALEAAKENMTDAKLDLAQLESVTNLPELGAKSPVVALLQEVFRQPEHASTFQSNEIIVVIKNLTKTFKQQKKEQDTLEFESRAASEKELLGYTTEKTFKEKEKLLKEETVEEKTTDKTQKETDKSTEETAHAADTAFKDELATACEAAATQFDQRSTTRAGELTAISKASDVLKSGVSEAYNANKNLAGLVALGSRPTLHAGKKPAPKPLSLLQVQQSKQGDVAGADAGARKAAAMTRALDQLDAAADRLGNPVLALLVSKATLKKGDFSSVKTLITDLITQLEQMTTDEEAQLTFCQTAMTTALQERDSNKMAIEGSAATIVKEETRKAQLLEEIAELAKEISEVEKGLAEATELRNEEKASNEQTLAEAEGGKTAVEEAIAVLKEFYDGAKFVQLQKQDPGADRDGNTVSGLAPTVSYDSDYKGNQDASKGIFGLLEIIQGDFERTITQVNTDESAADTTYSDFKSATETSIGDKNTDKGNKETEVTGCDDAVVGAQDAKRTAEELHANAVKELEKLSPMCVDGESSFEERKAKRAKTIEALNSAVQILDDFN